MLRVEFIACSLVPILTNFIYICNRILARIFRNYVPNTLGMPQYKIVYRSCHKYNLQVMTCHEPYIICHDMSYVICHYMTYLMTFHAYIICHDMSYIMTCHMSYIMMSYVMTCHNMSYVMDIISHDMSYVMICHTS